MPLNRAQEKMLSLERSTQVPTVSKGNGEVLADTFSPEQTSLFFFRLSVLKSAADISIQLMREACALKSQATRLLSAVERIAVLRENRVGNAATNRDRVNRSVLGEAA